MKSVPSYSAWTTHQVYPGMGHDCIAPGCRMGCNTDEQLCGRCNRRLDSATADDLVTTWRYYLRNPLSTARWAAYERIRDHVRAVLAPFADPARREKMTANE